ncbi:HEAT repeat domain-containing protein [Spongiivirga sp. MCCC 1A20706]|uniref:HEAT repeat domain-containing protein n=1 Tax=Spongiivirga sp. MCCC 1A20706 TaxID=3160963 RepID=UPI0039773070
MKKEEIKSMLIDYLEGNLSTKKEKEIADFLAKDTDLQNELNKLTQLEESFKKVNTILPSKKLSEGFYNMLEQEKQKQDGVVSLNQHKPQNNVLKNVWQVAAVVAFVFAGFTYGKYQQQQKNQDKMESLVQETEKMKQSMMLALVENQSASKRVQGVHFVNQVQTPNNEVLDALIKRMHFDDNANVRLAAIEALSKFTDEKLVRDELIVALDREEDPGLQISLIEILVSIQEKGAIKSMERLLQEEDTPTYVKDQVKMGLPSII